MNSFWSISLFWLTAFLFVVVALFFILPPLLRSKPRAAQASRRDINIAVYRDQMREMEADRANGLFPEDELDTAKVELETRLAEDVLMRESVPEAAPAHSRTLGYALGAVLPATAFSLYFLLGNPTSLTAIEAASAPPKAMTGEHDIKRMLQQVEAKVEADPKDGKSWAILGKTYASLGRWPEAWKAYQFAAELLPDNASLYSGQAEALAVLKKGSLQGEPMRLVNKALQLDPEDMKGLELAAANAFQEKNHAQAVVYLEKLSQMLSADDPFNKEVQAALGQARQLARTAGLDNLNAQPAPSAPARSAPPAATGATIRGSLDLTPALKAKLGAQDVIFLFARPAQGGPPVAAVRGPAVKFPMDFELSDRWAMNPGNLLSQHKQVTLVARISRSGGPMAQPGDMEGSVKEVAVGAQGVQLVIDKLIP